MLYGFISKLDDETTKIIYRNKKIPSENVYHTGRMAMLGQVLKSGDVVYVISCTRFASVGQVYAFAKLCYERGASLQFIAEPYLNIGNGKQWRPAVYEAVQSMMESEYNAKHRLYQGFKMSKEQYDYLYQCVELMNVEILSNLFSSDGVYKRNV